MDFSRPYGIGHISLNQNLALRRCQARQAQVILGGFYTLPTLSFMTAENKSIADIHQA